MSSSRLRLLCTLAVVLSILSGCTAHKQHRTRNDVCSVGPGVDCAEHALIRTRTPGGSDYLLGFVEFDDQGHLWDRRQMWSAIDLLSAEAGRKDLLMIVFVHGWKHNAAHGDGNIDTFREFLAQLSDEENALARQSEQAPRQVAGVYLGWRGESVPVALLNNLTFWDRKNVAQKVGHGDVTEVLGRLEGIKRDKDSISPGGRSRTRLAVVGHSFGGLVVHTALNQLLVSRFVRTAGPPGTQSDAEGFGNLVVLINPAFEAQQFSSLADMSTERGTYFASQLPVVAVLASTGDRANRVAFPLGRRLSTIFEKTRDVTRFNGFTRKNETWSEDEANVKAIGHFGPFVTHLLYPAPEPVREARSVEQRVEDALGASRGWEQDKPGGRIQFGDLILERTPDSAPRNPYLVIRTDDRLIRDHNDIADPRVIRFLKQLTVISTVPPDQKERLYRKLNVAPAIR